MHNQWLSDPIQADEPVLGRGGSRQRREPDRLQYLLKHAAVRPHRLLSLRSCAAHAALQVLPLIDCPYSCA